MPASVFHAKTMTTPDDLAWEWRPSDNNSAHLVTFNAVGSEISGAFSNAGNVSFGLDGGGFVTASANVTAAPSPVNVTGANGSSVNAQTIAFSNVNNITLGVSTAANGATVTGSFLQSVQTQASGAIAGSGFTSGGANVGISGTNNSAGLSLSVTVAAQSNQSAIKAFGVSNTGNTAGNTGISTGIDWVIAGSNNITASQSTAVGGPNTVWLSGPTLTQYFSKSNTTFNGANISGSMTLNTDGLQLSMSVAAPGGGAGITVSDNATSLSVSRLAFTQSNGLTLSLSTAAGAATVIGSYTVPTVTNSSMTVSDAGTSGTLARLAFTNLNGVTLSLSTGNGGSHTIVGSHNALTSQSNQNVTAANGGFAFQTLSFSNANAFSFGTSAGSAITGSYTVPSVTEYFSKTNTTFNGANISGSMTINTAGLQLSLSVAAPGAAAEQNAVNLLGANTSGNTTATGSTLGFSGVNLTLSGTNNSQIVFSAPATSSLVGSSGLSISTNGSTITAYAVARSVWDNFNGLLVAGTAQANSLVSVQPFNLEWPVVFSNVAFPMSINVGSQTNNSTAYIDVSASGVIYSRNASTLSSVASFSASYTATWTSNATATVTAGKLLTATLAGTTLTPGNYWLAMHISTNNTATGGANTTALANTVSMILGSSLNSAGNLIGAWGNQTNNTVALYSGLGIISTGATLATIPFSSITQTGSRAVLAPVAFALRNDTFQ